MEEKATIPSDLESGEETRQAADSDLTSRPRHTKLWFSLAIFTWCLSYLFYGDFYVKLTTEWWPREEPNGPCVSCGLAMFYVLVIVPLYLCSLFYMAFVRQTIPRKIARFDKLKFEFSLVIICTCLAIPLPITELKLRLLGYVLCFHVLPVMNLVYGYENFGILDFSLALFIEAAYLLFTNDYWRYAPLLILHIAMYLHMIKDLYYAYYT